MSQPRTRPDGMTPAPRPEHALSYGEALDTVLRGVVPLPAELVPIELALDRALASPITSPVALPPWDNAGMDGYAVRRSDVAGASASSPVLLRVVASIAAGADPLSLRELTAGVAMRIMTGAPIPPGAEAVVRVEDSDRGTEIVRIVSDRDLSGRANVRPRGEDVTAGETVFDAGTTIGASHLGTLASVGAAMISVHRRPRVVVVSSGDELVLLDQFDAVRKGTRIVSSTSYALPAFLRQAGAEVRMLPILPDDLEVVTNAVRDAVSEGCDLLVTTGGISVGAHDYTRDALTALGGTVGFWRARIRPGGPIGTGSVLGVPWLGLPGNPVSTMVTGALFAWPLIRAMGGHRAIHHMPLRVRMADTLETPAPLTYFARVYVAPGSDGVLEASVSGGQGSNLLRAMALANALLIVPELTNRVDPGMLLDALMIPGGDLLGIQPAVATADTSAMRRGSND